MEENDASTEPLIEEVIIAIKKNQNPEDNVLLTFAQLAANQPLIQEIANPFDPLPLDEKDYQQLAERLNKGGGQVAITSKMLPKNKTKRVLVYKNKKANVFEVKFMTMFPFFLIVLFGLIFVSLFSLKMFIPCLMFAGIPLVLSLKLRKKQSKLATLQVKEMFAIYKIPIGPPPQLFKSQPGDDIKIKKQPPVLKTIEVYNCNDEKNVFEPSQFSRPNQLDMKKLVNTSKRLKTLQKDYRVIKATPSPSYRDETVNQDIYPKIYLFNRDCLIFNKEVFKFLQLYSETSEKFRSSIFTFKTLTVDPESGWKPKNNNIKTKSKIKKKVKIDEGEEVTSKVKTNVKKRVRVPKKKIEGLNDSLPQA